MSDTETETEDGRRRLRELRRLAGMDADMAANPQPTFKLLRDEMPVLSIDIGSNPGVMLSRKEDIDFALRHTEIFSSNVDAVDLKNKRPMIPLQIDPPEHKKFRKLLDPIFAPRKMAAMDQEVSDLVNHLIDGFIERGEVDFAKEFSVPFPSEVFLTLLGLPMDELDTFLTMKDGIIRPEHVTGTAQGSAKAQAYQQKIADSVYEYFDKVLDEREKEPKDDLLSHFLEAEVEGDRLTREDILDICFLFLIAGLDTVTATLDCMFAFLAEHPEHRRQLVENPDIIPNAIEELLRWETPVMMVSRVAVQDTELAGCPVHKGDHAIVVIGSANTRRGRVPRRGRGALRPRGQPPHRVRRRHSPLPGFAPGPPRAAGRPARVAQADSRVRGRSRPRRSSTRRGSAPSSYFPMRFTARA